MYRGAEAVIYRKDGIIVKERIKKGYRIPELDEKLRVERTKKEARIMMEARRIGVPVPQILNVDYAFCRIEMEFIDGITLRELLDEGKGIELCEKVGRYLAILHKYGIVHGDLTTSNVIVKADETYFIDFGLADFSNRIEDKAVDIHLFKEALFSKHASIAEKCFQLFLKGYKSEGEESVVRRALEMAKRGRYAKR